jgi:PAS domain S-box-containing protein
MNGFWTLQQVFAFVIAAAAAVGVAWRVIRRLFRESTATHAKIDAIETLLEQVDRTGMTSGAEKSFQRLERRLLLTQAQVRLVMEVDGTGYVETNKDGGLIYCNTQFVHWTGMSIDDARGYGWASAVHPEDRARVTNDWINAIKEQRPIDLWYRYKYNSIITPVHARSVVVRDEHNNNETLGFVAIIVPIEKITNNS